MPFSVVRTRVFFNTNKKPAHFRRLKTRHGSYQFEYYFHTLYTPNNLVIFLTAIIVCILSFVHMLWLFTFNCNHEFDFVEERCKRIWLAIYRWERNLDHICRTNLGGYIICCAFALKNGNDYTSQHDFAVK